MSMKNFRMLVFTVFIILLQVSFLTTISAASPAIQNPLLKYVPAETLFFSGNIELVNLDEYPFFSLNQSFGMPLSQNERQILGKEFAFLYELYLDLGETVLQGNSAIQAHYGLAKEMAVILYSVGVSPVLKITLEDEQAFIEVLNQAEEKSGFYHKEGTFRNQKYRIYPMSDKHQLIVSTDAMDNGKKLATIAFMSDLPSEEQKEIIFGLTLPEQSIEYKIETIKNDNQYLPILVSFLDFRELVHSIFKAKNTENSSKNNSINKNPWVELLGDEALFFTDLSASNCKADMIQLAQEMPQLVAGYRNYKVHEQRVIVDFEVLLELKNK